MNTKNPFLRMPLGQFAALLFGAVFVVGLVGGILGARLANSKWVATAGQTDWADDRTPRTRISASGTVDRGATLDPSSFSQAASRGKASVVFITTLTEQPRRRSDDWWSFFDFYGNRGPISSAGSGVLLTDDGYIVTNNHVIERADRIEVNLPNKHTYTAKVIGTDHRTDLALLKIDATNLLPITLSNSDQVQIGDWVLAVGNPFNLTYTVTAGIVSAKGRNINIVNDQFPIESFIQTDAAINPGNSGGALINLQGELIGINTAIASQTGSYAGYGFAIPANIVRKVVDDLRQHGRVQQAFLGAEVLDIDNSLADKIGSDNFDGVYVESLLPEGAAEQAGIRASDVILAVGDATIATKAQFLEQISLYRPGDVVEIRLRRGMAEKTVRATLQNEEGTADILKDRRVSSDELGADITPLSKLERQTLGVSDGFRLTNIRGGRIAQMQLPEGFVILSWNGYVPESVAELVKLATSTRGRIAVEGISPDGSRVKYTFYSY